MENVGSESISHQPGACFRLVTVAGSLIRCADPVEFEGRFKDWSGNWHDVEACIEHTADLTDWSRINASVIDISTARRSRFRGPGPRPA